MAEPVLSVSDLRLQIDPQALVARHARVRVERLTLRVPLEAIVRATPAGAPVQVQRINGGRVYLRTSFTAVGGEAEIVPSISPQGRLRLEVVAFRAAGFLPIPVSLVVGTAYQFLGSTPGIHRGPGNSLELDAGELIRHFGRPTEVELAPLKSVTADGGVLELRL